MKKSIVLLASAMVALVLDTTSAVAQACLYLERQLALVGQQLPAAAPLQQASLRAAQTVRVPQQETYSTFVDETWLDEVSTTYVYNQLGQKESSYNVFLMPPVLESRSLYTYDEQGRPLEYLTQSKVGDEWVDAHKNIFVYEGENLKQYAYYTKLPGFDWQLIGATRFTHTIQAGRLTESVSETFSAIATDMHDWRNSRKLVYGYTGNSTRPDAISTYEWLAQNGGPAQWYDIEHETNIEYQGDSDKRTSYHTQQTSWTNGNSIVSSYKFVYQYTQNTAEQTETVVETKFAVSLVSGLPTLTPHTRTTSTALNPAVRYIYYPLSWLREAYTNGAWAREHETKLLITRNASGDITQTVQQDYDVIAGDFVDRDRYVYSNFADVTTTGAAEDLLATAVSVYPNPTQSNLHIALDASKVQEASLSIHNLTGQKVYELASLRGEAAIDMSHLPKGVYMVRIAGANSAGIIKKVVKQ